ncbi:MAG TPA: M23 family metallopeptidase [Thermoanaerobaculia bacterium]|nr:M23 family metallopeptidase [Thermoanaerobaculia bacterium]
MWLKTTTTVCTTDSSGTTCEEREYSDLFCYDSVGAGGGGGTNGGGGGDGGSLDEDPTPPPNPYDADADQMLDCYTDLTDSARATANPLPSDKNLGGRYGGPDDGVRWSHNGIDVRANQGDPVRAAQRGEVTEILTGQANLNDDPNSSPNGNFVRIRYGDGTEGAYLHLHSISVQPGDIVAAGEVIGTANNTGNSFGDHLHYTHWIDRYGSPKIAANPENVHGNCR